MSFFKALCLWFLSAAFVNGFAGLLYFMYSDDSETAFGAACMLFIISILYGLYKILTTKCPNCKKYLCFEKYKHEDLSRDVISKKVKDKELGTKLEHYAVGKRKHYYRCNECGYESTSIKDYKDKINV